MEDRLRVRTIESIEEGAQQLEQLLTTSSGGPHETLLSKRIDGSLIGTLVGFKDDAATPLVTYHGQPGTAAISARATLELSGAHIGREAVLLFEGGDPYLPIIVGCLHGSEQALLDVRGKVELEVDGERLVVSAKEQVVLRCGKASITLTRAGKVLISGTYLSSRSTGTNRIKGGSIQLN